MKDVLHDLKDRIQHAEFIYLDMDGNVVWKETQKKKRGAMTQDAMELWQLAGHVQRAEQVYVDAKGRLGLK